MEFKQYFEIFGLFNYMIPQEKEQQMYDFYMLALLRGRTNNKYINPMGGGEKPFYEPGNFEPGELESSEKQADYMLEEVAEKLLPYLKKELLDVLVQAVAGETKDALYFNDSGILELIVSKENPSAIGEFVDFLNELIVIMNPTSDEYDSYTSFDSRDSRYVELGGGSYKNDVSASRVLKIAKKSFSDMNVFMSVAKTLFTKADWNESYGGSKWAAIVDGYFRLKSATNMNSLIVAIDHVYDLQHNNGSIFTKIQNYGKDSGKDFTWIKKALDFKRDVKSASELLNKVSAPMKKLASRIIHIKNIA